MTKNRPYLKAFIIEINMTLMIDIERHLSASKYNYYYRIIKTKN